MIDAKMFYSIPYIIIPSATGDSVSHREISYSLHQKEYCMQMNQSEHKMENNRCINSWIRGCLFPFSLIVVQSHWICFIFCQRRACVIRLMDGWWGTPWREDLYTYTSSTALLLHCRIVIFGWISLSTQVRSFNGWTTSQAAWSSMLWCLLNTRQRESTLCGWKQGLNVLTLLHNQWLTPKTTLRVWHSSKCPTYVSLNPKLNSQTVYTKGCVFPEHHRNAYTCLRLKSIQSEEYDLPLRTHWWYQNGLSIPQLPKHAVFLWKCRQANIVWIHL